MRMSCNGCRVLRKGCSENCSIRPCLQWIKSPQSQANATFFLAKFYGRAGLINLLDAAATPDHHLRPAIFRSLLYEACGRIINPIHGSVGLVSSGTWHLCQAAVEAVLRGDPIAPLTSEPSDTAAAAAALGPASLKVYDIRHVSSKADEGNNSDAASNDRPSRVRTRKRSTGRSKARPARGVGSTSRESSVTHLSGSPDTECPKSAEKEPESSAPEPSGGADDGEIELELTLGIEPVPRVHDTRPIKKRRDALGEPSDDDSTCKVELGLEMACGDGGSDVRDGF